MARERPPIRSNRQGRAEIDTRRNQSALLKRKLLAKALKTTRGNRNLPPVRAYPVLAGSAPAVRKTKTATEAASGAMKGLRKLYVGDLAETTSSNDIQRDFGKFGKIRDIWIARNPPGFAFVDFFESTDAARALRVMDGSTKLGPKVKVEFAKKLGPKTSSALAFARRKMTTPSTSTSTRKTLPMRGSEPVVRPRRLSGARISGPLQRGRRLSDTMGGPPIRDRGDFIRDRLLLPRGRGLALRDAGMHLRERGLLLRERRLLPPQRFSPPLFRGRSPPERRRSPPRGPLSRYPPRRSISPLPRSRHYASPPPMPPLPPMFNPFDPRFREMALAGGWSRGRSPVMAPPPPLHPRYRSPSPPPIRYRGRSPLNRRSPGRFNRDRNRGRERDFDHPTGRHMAASLVYPPLSLPPPPPSFGMDDSPPRRLRSPPPPPPQMRGRFPPHRERSPFRRSPPRMAMHGRSPPPLQPPLRSRSPGVRSRERLPIRRSISPPPRKALGSPPPHRMKVGYRDDYAPPSPPPQRMRNESGNRRYSPPSPQRLKSGDRGVLSDHYIIRQKSPLPPRSANNWSPPGRKFSPAPIRNRSPPLRSRSRSPIARNMRSPPRPRSPSPDRPPISRSAWSPPPPLAGNRAARTPPRGYASPRNIRSRSPSNSGGRMRGKVNIPSPPSSPVIKHVWRDSPPNMSLNSQISNNRNLQQQSRARTPPRGYTPPTRNRSPPPVRYNNNKIPAVRYNNNKMQSSQVVRSPPPPRGRSPQLRVRDKPASYNSRVSRR